MRIHKFLLPLTVAAALLASIHLAGAQQSVDTHGKTEAQILKMGLQGWSDFYGEKEGSSTASMCDAAEVYGVIAKRRNDRILKSFDAKKKARIEKLRKLMEALATSSVDVAYNESGGGTMYNPMWASVTGVVEDTLFPILAQTGPKPKPMVVSMVTKQLAKVGRQIEAMHRDKSNSEFFKYGDAKKSLATMARSFEGIAAIAKGMPRRDSDRLLQFCFEHAKNADIDSSE